MKKLSFLLFAALAAVFFILSGCKITINATPEKSKYTVEYYYQNILDDEFSIDETQTENFKGETDSKTNVTADEVEGFTSKPVKQKNIEADGSTVVKIYYVRNTYQLTFDTDGGSSIEPVTLKYGATVTPPSNPTRTGFSFSQWEPKLPSTMPAKALNVKAVWAEGTATPYKVEHYQQNIDDDLYTLKDTENLSGTTNSNTSAAAKNYEGFTSKSFNQEKIEADGSTVVKIYYSRNSYLFTFNTDGGSGMDPVSIKYGKTIMIPENPTKASYIFKEWCPTVPETMPAQAFEVVAIWWQPESPITYYDQGGSEFTGTFTSTAPNIHKYSTETTLPIPSKPGYTFDGWYTQSDCQGNTTTSISKIDYQSEYKFYAKWKESVMLSVSNIEAYLTNVTDKSKVYTFKISDINPSLSDLQEILNNHSDIKIGYDLSECSGLTTIGSDAFRSCSGLTSVTIPSSVTSIGRYAFLNCNKLNSLTFEDTTTWYRVDDSFNWECKSGGFETDVSNPATNATNFRNTSGYYDYYWYKL